MQDMKGPSMIRTSKVSLAALGFLASSFAVALGGDADKLFPEFSDLKAPVLLPPNPKISVDKNGNYSFEGRPRFLIGGQLPEGISQDYAPRPGYDKSLSWLYERVPDYEAAQRIGFDSMSQFVPEMWVAQFFPGFKSFMHNKDDIDAFEWHLKELKLPVYVDFTCAYWLNGRLVDNKKLPKEALNSGGYEYHDGNHWVPYSMTHPEGKKLYMTMFTEGAKWVKRLGADALFYELFNEPGYNDPSPYNRKLFADWLKAKYGDVSKLDKVWRASYKSFEEVSSFKSREDNPCLFVDWSKFMEECFANLCKEGSDGIKAIDKDARCTVQMLGADHYRALGRSNVNLWLLAKNMEVVSTPTGGGAHLGGGNTLPPAASILSTCAGNDRIDGMMMRRYIVSVAGGKPIHDGEMYIGKKRESVADILWLELIRGGNASYVFKWCKWAKDWGTPEKGQASARTFPYMVLNPYATPPDALAGIMDFKKEELKVDDIFVPRENALRSKVALLLSFPNERYGWAARRNISREYLTAGAALEFGFYNPEIVLEEQFPEGRLSRYSVVVAPGVGNMYAASAGHLKKFVDAGGTLVLYADAMSCDEYGNPADWNGLLDLNLSDAPKKTKAKVKRPGDGGRLPGEIVAIKTKEAKPGPAWKTVVEDVDGSPIVYERKSGKGSVVFINAVFSEYGFAALLDSILPQKGAPPQMELSFHADNQLAVNVEARRFTKADGGSKLDGYFLFNWDMYPKWVLLKVDGAAICDPFAGAAYEMKDGKALVRLAPQHRLVLVGGPKDALEKRYGTLKPLSYAEQEAAAKSEEGSLQKEGKPQIEDGYKVDGSKMKTIDLRKFANRDFIDAVPGDGKGGWTDEGVASLVGAEWGVQTYRNVPCDIIRPDMNSGNGCIVLSSTKIKGTPKSVSGIPVDEKVKAIYFFHAVGWSELNTEVMRYVIHYADGSKVEIPVICGKDIDNWWFKWACSKKWDAKIAFDNLDQKGFFVWRWPNPQPEKEIDSIDIVSSNNMPIPIVVGITIEKN